jgi:hypothetical protein
MQIPMGNLMLAWAQWHQASDDYATKLSALEHGVPGAIDDLHIAGGRLADCEAAVDALSPTVPGART